MSIKVLDKGEVALIDHMGSDQRVIESARVSYQKGTKQTSDDRTLIRYMARHRHTSVFEQVKFTFYVKAPIFVIRQWMRHRTWSYNEISGRYSEIQDEFYIPELNRLQKQSKSNKQGSEKELSRKVQHTIRTSMEIECEKSFENYNDYLRDDLSRELARINLPLSTYTEMYATVDLHNLFHFIKLRSDSHAQWEIQQYSNALFDLIKPIVPISCKAFEDYVLNSVTFSKQEMEIVRSMYCISRKHGPVNQWLNEFCERLDLSKREVEEFKIKLGVK